MPGAIWKSISWPRCPQWHGLSLGIIDSTTVMGQKRVLIIDSGSSFTLILLLIKAVAVARNTGACCL